MHVRSSLTDIPWDRWSHPIYTKVRFLVGSSSCAGKPFWGTLISKHLAEFADLGHKLFRTTPETYPIAFVPGDAFDPKHLEVVPPFTTANAPSGSAPDLRSLTSLNPLRGRVDAIHASSFFHLFDEEKQLYLARALAGLLSPKPGSMIFGLHVGLAEKGFRPSLRGGTRRLFCHSPESWAQVWDGMVFEKGVVIVRSKLVQVEKKYFEGTEAPEQISVLVWSVTRS